MHHLCLVKPGIGTMELKLKPFDFAKAATSAGMADVAQRVQAKARLAAASGPEATSGATGTSKVEPSFQLAFSRALTDISKSQQTATTLQKEVQFDNPTVSLEETMVAMQKAQLGFQSAVQFRNKLVQAYTDIMNMQV